MEQNQLKSYLVFGLDWSDPDLTRVTEVDIRKKIYPLVDWAGDNVIGKYCAVSPVSQSKLDPNMPLELFHDELRGLGFAVARDYYNAHEGRHIGGKEDFIGVVPITFLEPRPSRYLVVGGHYRSIPHTLVGRLLRLSSEEEKLFMRSVALETDKLNAELRRRIEHSKNV